MCPRVAAASRSAGVRRRHWVPMVCHTHGTAARSVGDDVRRVRDRQPAQSHSRCLYRECYAVDINLGAHPETGDGCSKICPASALDHRCSRCHASSPAGSQHCVARGRTPPNIWQRHSVSEQLGSDRAVGAAQQSIFRSRHAQDILIDR